MKIDLTFLQSPAKKQSPVQSQLKIVIGNGQSRSEMVAPVKGLGKRSSSLVSKKQKSKPKLDKKDILTAEVIRSQFDYDPETGILTRIATGRYRRGLVGKAAGCTDAKGYIKIHINNISTYGHILAWIHYYGVYPDGHIDHIDQDPANNRIQNLRIVNAALNQRNAKLSSRNQTGYIGVSYSYQSDKPYKSATTVNGQNYHHGYFATAKEASDAREAWIAARPELGFTKRHGK